MAHLGDKPTPVVFWVDRGRAFKDHLASTIEALREMVKVETFIDSQSALQAMSAAINSCRNESKETERRRVACVITNMQRNLPISGLVLLQAMQKLYRTNILSNEYSSYPPAIVYSSGTFANPGLSAQCRASGAMLVFSDELHILRNIIMECALPSVPLTFIINPLAEQSDILSNIPTEYHPLFSTHCLTPLPDIYGGRLLPSLAQQLVLMEWRLLNDVLLKDILQAFKTHCTSEKYYIGGGLAINQWLKSRGYPPILTRDCDFRFEKNDNVKQHAHQMKLVLEQHTQTIRVHMAFLGIKCGEVEVSNDDFGCRISFPFRYYNSSSHSCEKFIWKVFDVSHNWHGDPIDTIKENGLTYIGEQEILKELQVDYGSHKEQRRQLRSDLINFVLNSS